MAEQLGSNYYNSPFKFNGKELDEETGFYYYGARYYDPKISIWLSVDPLAEKYPSVNSYAYCFNNPVNFIDPDGLEPITSTLMAVFFEYVSQVSENYFEKKMSLRKAMREF